MNQQQHDAELRILLTYLFQTLFCDAEKLDAEERIGVFPPFFFGWLQREAPHLSAETICIAAGVDPAVWDAAVELANDPYADHRTLPVWNLIVAAHKPAPTAKVKRLSLILLTHFDDGTMSNIAINADQPPEAPNLTDGELAAFVAEHHRQFIRVAVDDGLDKLHAAGYKLGGDETLAKVLGVFLSIKEQFPETHRRYMEAYARLCHSIICPPPPPPAPPQSEPNWGGFNG